MVATGRTGRFNRAAFTDEMLAFVSDRGLDQLSMRSLGEALGVSHMAVYHHFPGGRDELLQVTTDAVLSQIDLPEFSDDWIEWLVQTAERVFDVLSRYPGVGAHVFARHPVYLTSGVTEMIDTIMGTLLNAGLTEAEAVEVWTVGETWLVGQLWIAEATRDRPPSAPAEIRKLFPNNRAADGTRNLRRVARLLLEESAGKHLSSGLRDLLTGFSRRTGRTR
ncbi:putative transcriptional regulator, TetR family protein [Mycobacterium paraseoulense]|uniref:HTH tetR-type domain-containing protein n=2 Tax=Mycobacterium paraseoulense TaxID=590652 RepID=A0A1X0IFK3_9MYCO|nr:hypothetical protein BST39_04645 [Mycobacterium paraseoulense]BBZ70627.1 putative transcriptional regulator, TetR family protein [Mycobacterium paraseoulense]